MQEPKVRPSAKYLQQHKFVAVPRPGAQASLVPLISRSQDLLQQAAAAEQAAQASRCRLCIWMSDSTKILVLNSRLGQRAVL